MLSARTDNGGCVHDAAHGVLALGDGSQDVTRPVDGRVDDVLMEVGGGEGDCGGNVVHEVGAPVVDEEHMQTLDSVRGARTNPIEILWLQSSDPCVLNGHVIS